MASGWRRPQELHVSRIPAAGWVMGVRIWIGPWVIQTSVSPLDFPGLCTHHAAWVRACGLRGRDWCRSRGPGGRGARGREQVAWAQSETRGRGWSSRGSWGGGEWGKTHGKGGSRGSVGGKPRHRAQQHLKDEQGEVFTEDTEAARRQVGPRDQELPLTRLPITPPSFKCPASFTARPLP